MIGTSLSVAALFFLVVADQPADFMQAIAPLPALLTGLGAWLACITGNIYIVGLNQLEDIDIDKINKPNLPLAAGNFSTATGRKIVAVCALLSLGLGAILGKFLLAVVGVSLAIGTAYSLPPFRLKRFPVLAALCILTVRGGVVNLGLFWHFQDQLLVLSAPSAAVLTLTWFIVVFTVAIALGKDMPDLSGDQQYNIATFTIKWGKVVVFNLCRWFLAIAYLGITIATFLWLPGVNQWFLLLSHGVALGLLLWQSTKVDLQSQTSITRFYQLIWKLFFWEYIAFPLGLWLGKLS